MTAASLTAQTPVDFVKSESKTLGTHGGFINKMRDNAPKITAVCKLGGDIATGLTMSPLLIGYATFAIMGRIVLLAWANKKNQAKMAAEHARKEGEPEANFIHKILHPKQYPVESSAGLSVVSEVFDTGYGVQCFMSGATGFTPMLLGSLALWSYGNILFGKEKKKHDSKPPETPWEKIADQVVFSKSESQATGFTGRIQKLTKGNPVLVSSLMLSALCATGIIGGLVEGIPTGYVVALGMALVGNLVQAIFVRKNEYNVEGAKDAQQKPETFQERVSQERKDNSGVQLA